MSTAIALKNISAGHVSRLLAETLTKVEFGPYGCVRRSGFGVDRVSKTEALVGFGSMTGAEAQEYAQLSTAILTEAGYEVYWYSDNTLGVTKIAR